MELNSLFWKNIQKVKQALLIDDVKLAELMDVSKKEFIDMKSIKSLPPIHKLDNFCENLGVGLNNFIDNDFDLKQVQNNYFGNDLSLPEKYDFGKLSKSRTIINCLDYVEAKYGLEVKSSLLKSMQLNPNFFNDSDRDININVLKDLCDRLKAMGFSDEELKNLGRQSYYVNKDTELGKTLKVYKKIPELFDVICSTLNHKFDKNFDYYVSKVKDKEVYITSKPSQLAQESLKTKIVGTKNTCASKIGVFETFPYYIGQTNTIATKTKCIYQGDSVVEYLVKF